MTTTTKAGMTKTVIHPRTQTEGGGGNALDAIALYVNVCECVCECLSVYGRQIWERRNGDKNTVCIEYTIHSNTLSNWLTDWLTAKPI